MDIKKKLNRIMEADSDHAAHLQKTGFWGKQGAGLVFFSQSTDRFCFSLRSELVTEPRTWSTWGGAIDEDENPREAAVREAHEETKLSLDILKMIDWHINIVPDIFKYTSFIAVVEEEFEPQVHNNWEVDGYEWCKFGQWPSPLHRGMKETLSDSQAVSKMKQLIKGK